MKIWEQFESDCLEYLHKKFNKYATFEGAGGSDSTVSDIRVMTKSNKEFFIEAKHTPSQCGQFVLIPNEERKQFNFSPLNASKLTKNVQTIINHMNNNFDLFLESGTKGTNIIFDSCEDIFIDWVIDYYKDKNTKFIISNNYTILPINRFEHFFNISGTYRIKKSGSSGVAMSQKDAVIKHLSSLKLKGFKYYYNNGHLDVFTSDNVDKNTFKIANNTFMFSKRENSYEIRKLSNTYNANVIFSIDIKNNVKGLTDQEFIKYLTQ